MSGSGHHVYIYKRNIESSLGEKHFVEQKKMKVI